MNHSVLRPYCRNLANCLAEFEWPSAGRVSSNCNVVRWLMTLLLVCGLADGIARAATPPQWLWIKPQAQEGEIAYFRHLLEIPKGSRCRVDVLADNEFWLYVNGRFVGAQEDTQSELSWKAFEVSQLIQSGSNLIAVRVRNLDGPAGFAAQITLTDESGKRTVLGSDTAWQAQQQVVPGWNAIPKDLPGWKPATVLGTVGATAPWGEVPAATGLVTARSSYPPRRTLSLSTGDRVVWVGGTFVERAQRYGFLESSLLRFYPGHSITMRNLGWSGDTVWAESRGIFDSPAVGYQRMIDQVRELRPTVAVLHYGTNESFAGSERLDAFRTQLTQLVMTLQAEGTTVVLATPILQLDVPPQLAGAAPPRGLTPQVAQINQRLQLYAQAIEKLGVELQLPVLDLTDLYQRAAEIAGDSPRDPAPGRITEDGVHLNEFGYQIAGELIADRWLTLCGTMPTGDVLEVDLERRTAPRQDVIFVEKTSDGLWELEYRPRLLPAPPLNGVSVRPMRLVIRGLPEGKYRVSSGGVVVGEWTAEHLAGDGGALDRGEHLQASAALREAVMHKNELYFHQWRPQNITYLFGFRRHEQGGNAREIAEFRDLVHEAEQQVQERNNPSPGLAVVIKVERVKGGESRRPSP